MTPRLASRHPELVGPRLDTPRDPRRCRWFAIGLFVTGFAVGVVLIASGHELPEPGSLLLVVVLFGLAVNRVALFPSELAVTAEAAVLLAAIVGFRGDGPLVGPWFVALLAGPLDVVHWRQRSFVRMAYNAGNRMVATLLAATVFAIVTRAAGQSGEALAAGAFAASITFALVEGAVGTVLVRLHSAGRWLDAALVELPMELLTVPLGVIGAGAGYLATDVGWWCAVALLTPTVFLPELAIVRSRRARSPVLRVLAVIVPAGAVLAAVAVVVPLPAAPILAGLVAVGVAAGLELRIDGSVPLALAALVGVAVVVGGDAAPVAATLLVAAAVATARAVTRARRWTTPVLTGGAALGAAMLYDVSPSRAFALLAALAFAVLVVAVRSTVSGPSGIVWIAPLVCVSVSLGYVWRAIGLFGVLVFVVGMVATSTAMAWFGALPWTSRFIGPRVARRGVRWQRVALVVASILSLCLAIVACAVVGERRVLANGAVALAAAVASMAMGGVRQWRFAPRPRARDASALLGSAVTAVVAVPALLLEGSGWSVVVLTGSLLVSTAIAWPLAGLAAAAAPARASSGSERVDR